MAEPRPARLLWCMTAEMIGTFILVFFGCGAVHSAVLTDSLSGLWQVATVWGVAIMLAIYTVGAISGAHINPAITLGLAAWRLFPLNRVAGYLVAQFVGAFLAAAALYTLYGPYLARLEVAHGVERGQPGSELSAMCYGEYFPNPGVESTAYLAQVTEGFDAEKAFAAVPLSTACLAEIVGTAILAFVVLATTDPANRGGPRNLAP
ncbi:MAG: aquaporin, partial [Planctomycetales bacterium]|nr:aquaporin [Planctomycetales bacterium]